MVELQILLLKAYSVRIVLDRASRDKSADKRTCVRILGSPQSLEDLKILLDEKSTALLVGILRKIQKWMPDFAIYGWAAISRRRGG